MALYGEYLGNCQNESCAQQWETMHMCVIFEVSFINISEVISINMKRTICKNKYGC